MTDLVRVLNRHDFQLLLNALAGRAYRIVGPTVRDAAVVYDEIHSASDLPEGRRDCCERSGLARALHSL